MTPLAAGATVAQARRTLAERFRRAGLDSPELDARILLGHVLALDHTALASASDRALNAEQAHAADAAMLRRLEGEPVSRIVGFKEFWGLSLELSAETLVPRPDTETVVEAALAVLAQRARVRPVMHIADLGTGSGALLLALLHECPTALGVATDISIDALQTAKRNAERLDLLDRMQVVACDFGAALGRRFDLVVSNPPYIPSDDIDTLPPEVRRDPRRALDGGGDGLDAYRRIAAQARALLVDDGVLIVELGQGQERDVSALFAAAGLVPSPARPDLAGVPRALVSWVAPKPP